MNRFFFRAALLAVLGPWLAGCETAVDVDAPPHTPRLALSYTLSTQTPDDDYQAFFESRQLFVSTSQPVLNLREPEGRNDATVQVFDAATGQVVEEFGPAGRLGYYQPARGFVAVQGRRYTLRATAPRVAPVEATLTVPARPVVESANYVARLATPGGNREYRGRLTVAVADNPATADYYLAYARVLDAQGNYWGRAFRDNSTRSDGPDVQLGRFALSEGYSLSSQRPYADQDGGNGQRLSLVDDVQLYYEGNQWQNPPAPAFVEVTVSGITPDAYRFYQSVQRYEDTDGNPFAEPAPLHSNVPGGYGLFGGAADAVVRVPL